MRARRLRVVRLESPLTIGIDGKKGTGVVTRPGVVAATPAE